MVWYSHLLKNFPQFIVIHIVKGFGIVNKAKIEFFFIVFSIIQRIIQLLAQLVKNPSAMQETPVGFLGWDDPLEKGRVPTPVFWPREFHGLYSPGSSVQLLSCVQLFATTSTAARQASLSITNSPSLLRLMSIESVMPSNHLILCHPPLLLPSVFPSIRV